jgi:hypothetical protein
VRLYQEERHARESNPHAARSVTAIYRFASADRDRVPSTTWCLAQSIGLSQLHPSDFDSGETVCDDIIKPAQAGASATAIILCALPLSLCSLEGCAFRSFTCLVALGHRLVRLHDDARALHDEIPPIAFFLTPRFPAQRRTPLPSLT